MIWCSGLRLVARLLDRRPADRGGHQPTLVHHRVTGWSLRFDTGPEAQRFLDRYCCEPSAFEVTVAGDEAEPTAA
jgi:hypothetical protein